MERMFRRGKYKAKRTGVDGQVFASKKEARRYVELKNMEAVGEISGLVCQPKYVLQEGFRHEGRAVRELAYVADFSYTKAGRFVVEDVKGFKTEVYKIKAKLFLAKWIVPNGWVFLET